MRNAFILSGLLASASALALPQLAKRDIVWETKYAEVTETHWSTKTVWVDPSEATSLSAAGFQGYEQPQPHSTKTHTKTKTYVAPKPTSTYVAPVPSSTYVAPVPTTSSTSTYVPPPAPPSTTSTSVYVAPTPTSTYVAPAPTTTTPTSTYVAPTTSAAPAATSKPASYSSGSSSSSSGSFTGEGTFYDVGLGSCGITSTASEPVVAIGHGYMQASYSGNPNLNPLCGKKISISYGGKTTSATIVDTCAGCAGTYDVDMSTSLFDSLADPSTGRIYDVKWSFA